MIEVYKSGTLRIKLMNELKELNDLLNPNNSFGGRNINIIRDSIKKRIKEIEELLKPQHDSSSHNNNLQSSRIDEKNN